jgi:MFS family permease
VIFLFLAPVSGILVKKFGARWLMVSGTLAVAAGYFWLSAAHPGQSYAAGILPGIVLWGLGLGLSVTPLTAAVLAAVGDADLGEASGINDASSRIGGVIVIALVPVLIGVTGGQGYAHALAHGYLPSMIVMGGLCVAAALVTALFVSDARTAHRSVPRAPDGGCAVPVPAPARS